MDAQIKTKWVEALRSGEYEQATGRLKDGNEFCCLGVLCTVMGAQWRDMGPYLDGFSLRDENDDELLSLRTLDSVGFGESTQGTLVKMNDDGISFPEIADYIEKHL
jgi:hypothetical protein